MQFRANSYSGQFKILHRKAAPDKSWISHPANSPDAIRWPPPVRLAPTTDLLCATVGTLTVTVTLPIGLLTNDSYVIPIFPPNQ